MMLSEDLYYGYLSEEQKERLSMGRQILIDSKNIKVFHYYKVHKKSIVFFEKMWYTKADCKQMEVAIKLGQGHF